MEKPVNFNNKINQHFTANNIDDEMTEAINEFLVFLIRCFNDKNDFYVPDFNKNVLIYIKRFYTKLKTNILNKTSLNSYTELLNNIDNKSLKCMKFVLMNYINSVCPNEERKLYIKMVSIIDNVNAK